MEERPFKIDGVAIPTPSSYKFSLEDLSTEATGRTLDGIMHKDIIDDKDTYECRWDNLSWEDTATLLNAVNKKQQVAFTHADPRIPNQFVTYNFYVGKRTVDPINLSDPNRTWTKITFSFIRI